MRPPRSCTPRSCTRLRARLASVALALFANAFALANPFPYAPFMVMTYGLTANRDEVERAPPQISAFPVWGQGGTEPA